MREELKNDDITINYEKHEAIFNRYAELKKNKLKTNQECIEGAAKFGSCDKSNIKKILLSRKQREQAHSKYWIILSKLYHPIKDNNTGEIDEEKLIEQKKNFFVTVDKDKHIRKIMKEKYKRIFIEKYKKMGIEFNPDNTVTVYYSPHNSKTTSVPTLEKYLRHYYRTASEDFIQQDSEQILVKYLRHVGKPENYIALKLEEYLQYLGRSEDYIQNRFKELRVEKYNSQKSIHEKIRFPSKLNGHFRASSKKVAHKSAHR